MQLGTSVKCNTLLVSLAKGEVHLHCLCLEAKDREEISHLACFWAEDLQVLALTLELVLMLVESN